MQVVAQAIFLILIVQTTVCLSQTSALAPYLKIKPFFSTREDVEKFYGKGEFFINDYFRTYKSNDYQVSVGYSLGGCERKNPIWNIPEWTVTEIYYGRWKNPPKLKDLIGNGKNFKKSYESDVLNHVQYYDEKNGIKILYDEEEKGVLNIKILPSQKDDRKFDCDNLK